ncbi:MAG: hypothetical protein FWG27_08520 [Treponema sp.]|nr:hypothetical protein [Treponema sp.]
MKRFIFLLVFAVIIAGGVFAQTGGSSGINNWISGEASLLGAGLRYERMLNDNISIGGTLFWHSFFFFWNSVGIQAAGRYYFGSVFYAELGLGYGTITGTEDVDYHGNTFSWVYVTKGFMVTPAIGWKIDVGAPGGFYINPMIALPIVFGSKTYDVSGSKPDSEFKIGINFRPAIGLGYAF